MTESNDAIVRTAESIESTEIPAGTGTSMQVLIGADAAPRFAMRRFTMAPGGGMPRHTNTVEHEQYVLEGRATIGIGDETHEVRAGDVVYIPAGVPHWYRASDDAPFRFLCLVPNLPDTVELVDED